MNLNGQSDLNRQPSLEIERRFECESELRFRNVGNQELIEPENNEKIRRNNQQRKKKKDTIFSKLCSEVWKDDSSLIANCGRVILIIISSPCWIPIVLIILLFKLLKLACKALCKFLEATLENIYVRAITRTICITIAYYFYFFGVGLYFSACGFGQFLVATFCADYKDYFNTGIFLFFRIHIEILKTFTYYNGLSSFMKYLLKNLAIATAFSFWGILFFFGGFLLNIYKGFVNLFTIFYITF